MTTTTVRIWCPGWCTVTEERHVADLENLEGEVIHSSDSAGTAGAVTDEYALSAIGSPDGALYPELPTHTTMMLIADNGEMVHPDDLEYDDTLSRLHISDPYFAFYLRWGEAAVVDP